MPCTCHHSRLVMLPCAVQTRSSLVVMVLGMLMEAPVLLSTLNLTGSVLADDSLQMYIGSAGPVTVTLGVVQVLVHTRALLEGPPGELLPAPQAAQSTPA